MRPETIFITGFLIFCNNGLRVSGVSSGISSIVTGSKLLLDCPSPDEPPLILTKGNVEFISSIAAANAANVRGSSFPSSGESSSGDEAWDRFRPLILRCKAAYPITWEFQGNKPPDLSVETISEVDNVLAPTKRCFYSNLKVLASGYTGRESRTGNYTCKGLDGVKKSSIYRFAHDGASIFNNRKTMESKVLVKNGIAQAFVPCTANIANLNATLLRIVSEGTNTSFVPLDSSIESKYDPKLGFLISSKNETALAGKFVCSGIYKNETELVEVSVAPATDFIVSPTRKHLTFRNGRLSASCRSHEPVVMRLEKLNSKVQQHIQESMYKSDFLKYGAIAELFAHPEFDSALRGEINCVKKSSGEILHSWSFDTDYGCKCTWTLKPDLFKTTRFFFLLDRTLRGTIRAFGLNTEGDSYYMNLPTPRGELSCTSVKSPKVNLTYIACENPTECQIKSQFLNWYDFDARAYGGESAFSDEEEEGGNVTTISQGYIRSGIIKCGVEDYVSTQIAIANLDTLYIDSIPSMNLVRIIAPENNVFVGDKMLFTCLYEKFQLAREAKWAFAFANGTISFLDIDKTEDRTSFDLEKYQRTSYITISSPEISSLMCFVPVWNSTEWKNTSYPLNVSSAVPITPGSDKNCPMDSSPIIILQRNSSISSRRTRLPHLVSNSTISLYNPVTEVQLICRANYPVQWVYNGEPQNTSKIGKVPCSQSSQNKKVYEALLRIDPLRKEASGNYSCRKTFANFPSSSLYIYAVGDGEPAFIHEGRHLQVVKREDDPEPTVVLPCGVSNPDSKPFLFIDHEDSERIVRLELSSRLIFDPRIGFRLDRSLAPDPVTTFICSMSGNASSFGVLVTLRSVGEGASEFYTDRSSTSSKEGNGMLISFTVFLVALVIALLVGLGFMYKKCQEAKSSTVDVSQLGNTDTARFSSYDDVRIGADDRENIVADGSYNRFN